LKTITKLANKLLAGAEKEVKKNMAKGTKPWPVYFIKADIPVQNVSKPATHYNLEKYCNSQSHSVTTLPYSH